MTLNDCRQYSLFRSRVLLRTFHAQHTLLTLAHAMIIAQFVSLRFVHSSCFLANTFANTLQNTWRWEARERVALDDFQFLPSLKLVRSFVRLLARSFAIFPRARELWIFRSTFLSARTYAASIPSSSEVHSAATPVTRNREFSRYVFHRALRGNQPKETRSRTLTSVSWILFDYRIFRWGCFLLARSVCTRKF